MNSDNTEIINDLAIEVRNFKRSKNGKTWSWSCVVCGDSIRDKRKARFGVTMKQGTLVCHCFNCGYSNTFSSYLKKYHPSHYENFVKSNFDQNINTLYDLNHLVDLDDTITIRLFYIDKCPSIHEWLGVLNDKKINLSKPSFKKLLVLYRRYWDSR